MTTGYALLNQKLNLDGNTSIATEGTGEEGGETDTPTTDPDDVSNICQSNLEKTKSGGWSNTYQYNIVITNNSGDAYYTWKIKFPKIAGITLQYGSGTISDEGDYWLLTSYDWNGTIAANSSYTANVTFQVDNTNKT